MTRPPQRHDPAEMNVVQIRRVRGRSHIVFRPSQYVAISILCQDAYRIADALVDAAETVELEQAARRRHRARRATSADTGHPIQGDHP